jgi:tRNA A58 N-methylase Trm61
LAGIGAGSGSASDSASASAGDAGLLGIVNVDVEGAQAARENASTGG